jgi:hypothetical protein
VGRLGQRARNDMGDEGLPGRHADGPIMLPSVPRRPAGCSCR